MIKWDKISKEGVVCKDCKHLLDRNKIVSSGHGICDAKKLVVDDKYKVIVCSKFKGKEEKWQ